MSKSILGEFEELILLIVMYLEDDAYGNSIVKAIEEHQGREVNISAVHITLYRLEKKALVSSRIGEPTSVRGGRRKRYFSVTKNGINVLYEVKASRTKLWNLIPQFKLIE